MKRFSAYIRPTGFPAVRQALLPVSGLLAAMVLASGCATSRIARQAPACPKCKVVAVIPPIPVFDGKGKPQEPRGQQELIRTEHSCPVCQGALTTFFKEGLFHHKCSICEREAFSCPIAHR